YAELYRMGAVTSPEELADTMRRVEESATRMGLLVDDLLALARLDEPAATPVREPVDLVALARDAAQDLVALDPSRDVTVLGLDRRRDGLGCSRSAAPGADQPGGQRRGPHAGRVAVRDRRRARRRRPVVRRRATLPRSVRR